MNDETLLKQFSSREREMIEKLSAVVDIVGEIYQKQRNQSYPAGNLYPHDITREEFDQAAIRDPDLRRFDTVVERAPVARQFKAIPYNKHYPDEYRRLRELVEESIPLAPDDAFQDYLQSLVICLDVGTPAAYWRMMRAWVKTKDYHLNFPFTYDEPYMDRLVGVKGGFNAGLFVENEELAPLCAQLVRSADLFEQTLQLPGKTQDLAKLYSGIFKTINHQGMMAEMKLRAWNLPNDHGVREEVGSRQIIIQESVEREFRKRGWPVMKSLFDAPGLGINEEQARLGQFMDHISHELSHNIGDYEGRKKLEKYEAVYDELRACVLPLLWMNYLEQSGQYSHAQAMGGIVGAFVASLIDIVMAKKIKARESYRDSAFVEFNFFRHAGALKFVGGQITFDYAKMIKAAKELLDSVVYLSSRGNLGLAKKYMDQYGSHEGWEEVLAHLNQLADVDV